jgi:hypothetical protein
MPRRRGRRISPRPTAGTQLRLGSHWRDDGAPKTAYVSQGEALSVADERRQDTGVELAVYRCEVCSAWHMGKQSGREW